MAEGTIIDLQLFGSFQCCWTGGESLVIKGAKQRALLALLASAANGTHTRAWLQETLWSLSGEELGRASLRRALSDLRRIFGDQFEQLFSVSNIDITLRLDKVKIIGTIADGEFLEGLSIREAKFQDWLRGRREANTPETVLFSPEVRAGITPCIAVLPFAPIGAEGPDRHFGDLLSMEVCRSLSRSKMMDVISYLSSRRFSGTLLELGEVNDSLNCDYLIHGTVRVEDSRFRVDADFINARSGHVIWTRTFHGHVAEVLAGDSMLVQTIATQAGQAMLRAAVELAQSRPLPEIESHALFMSSISLMHQHQLAGFSRARQQLEELIRRAPQHTLLYAWMAKWYILAISQGWSTDPAKDSNIAADCTKRALDINPYCAPSLTIDGMIQGDRQEDFSLASARFQEAIQIDPNQSLGWLMFSRMHSFLGQGKEALHFANRANSLSPLDPHRYFYDIMTANAHLVEGNYEAALSLAERSLQANPRHTSSHRMLVITLQQMGRQKQAEAAAKKLMKLEPNLTISRYLDRHPAGTLSTGRTWAQALQQAGIPSGA